MRSPWFARLHLLALLFAAFGWLLGTSFHFMQFLNRAAAGEGVLDRRSVVVVCILVTVLFSLLMAHWLPELAARGRLFPGQVLGLMSLIGAIAVWHGVAWYLVAPDLQKSFRIFWWVAIAIGGVAIFFSRVPTFDAPRFPFKRSHSANGDARRCLLVIALHAMAVALAVGRALEFPAEPGEPFPFPRVLFTFGAFNAIGVLLSLTQKYPHRAVGLLPYGAFLVALGFITGWIAPQAQWPVALLGVGAGLAHTGPRSWLILLVPAGQRGGAALFAALTAVVGASVGVGLTLVLPVGALPPVRAVIGLALFAAAVVFFFREFFEQTLEFILWIGYPVSGYGPGMLSCPTRGPVLVIANHAAWLDPIWLSKVMPVQLRPMMVSRFFDLPVIRFLMRRVFLAIRVPNAGFRRETPEVQEAIAALERGQNVLIFPEGALRRNEEQSVRRFGQGVYQILRKQPQTPVITCWIEGGWGSYTSFFKGAPTKNKKMDWFRRIRIGVSDPEVLSLELLHDGHRTRRHLMLAVLHARRHLGLEPLPEMRMMNDE